MKTLISIASAFVVYASAASAQVYNLKIVTDASPDYSDLPSLVQSVTSRWDTPEQKCWALFYWNHIARRQTMPMELHGLALTDPIRQFNDYGYTMCSTISGINCSIWDALGLKARYWDISQHTVPEVQYGGRWHMYDNSMSAIYTLCDGVTIAGVEDIGKEGSCAASGGKVEPGHIAKYHCLNATGPMGFLTGADSARDLPQEAGCFNPHGLKYRTYFYDWDRGHRYILNLREGETYTRYYHSLGDTPEFFVPNRGKDPEAANPRYHIRGNGVRIYKPSSTNGIYKIEGANVITSLRIKGGVFGQSTIAVSTCNGLSWKDVWTGEAGPDLKVVNEVNGAYEVLVKVTPPAPLEFETTTMLNSKTQPKLNLGRNTIYVGAGDQMESIVAWPDLQGNNYKPYVVEEKNIATKTQHPGYTGVMYASKPNEDAYVVFKVDAPRDITRVTYGGRLYNRAPKSRIDFLHSFDNGETWIRSYTLSDTQQPWDVIHYETLAAVPAGTKSVLFKYVLNGPEAGPGGCSLYAVRMEVNHQPAEAGSKPVAVTFNWSERQKDRSLVERSHTEIIKEWPHRYTISVGGDDQPIVNFLRVGAVESISSLQPGYSDGHDAGGQKFVPQWVTYGRNLALGKPYTVSTPSKTNWGAGDPNGKKLTDGIVGPPYAGGTGPSLGLLWDQGQNPEITVDLGATEKCGAFRIQLSAGWPWWDALKGEVKDQVEVLTSEDGQNFASAGFFQLNLRWRDLPVNMMWPDEETLTGYVYDLAAPQPISARYVRFKIKPARSLTVSEVEVLDWIKSTPFDLRVALP